MGKTHAVIAAVICQLMAMSLFALTTPAYLITASVLIVVTF
jgi:hypothetical protein